MGNMILVLIISERASSKRLNILKRNGGEWAVLKKILPLTSRSSTSFMGLDLQILLLFRSLTKALNIKLENT